MPERFYSRFDPRSAEGRILIAGLVGVVTAFVFPSQSGWTVGPVVGWDASAITQLGLIWWIIGASDPRVTKCRAASADPGRTLVWVIVLLASCFSLFAGAVVLRHARSIAPEQRPLLVGLCLVAVVTAWALTHTAYTLR